MTLTVYTVKLCVLLLLVVDATGQNVSEVKLPGITPPPVPLLPLLPLLPPPPPLRPGMDGVLNKVVYLTRSTVASSDLIRQATPPPEEAYGIPDKEIYLSKSFDLIATASFDALPQPDIDVTVDPEEETASDIEEDDKQQSDSGQSPLLQRIIHLPEPKSRADEILVKRKVITTGPSIFLTEAMQRDGYDVPEIEPEQDMPYIAYLTLNPKDFLTEEMQRDDYDYPEMEPEQDMPHIAYLTTNTIGSSEPTAPTSKMDNINLSEQQQKGNTSELGEQSGVSNKGTEKVTLYVTSVMYYVSPVILVCGATLQIFLILRFHRDHLGSYITMLFDSVMKLIFIIMVLVVIHYDKRDTLICGIRLCTEMTCIGCVCLSTMLATLYKLIMIKFPLTSYRWTSTRTQLKVCLLGTLFVFVCSTWIGWDTFELGTQMGFCNYKSNNYQNFMIGWIVLIIGGTTIASVCMLIYIAYIVLKFRIQKVKRDGNQKSASATKTETSFVLDTSVSVDNSGAIPVKAQPMVKVSEKSSPPEKAKFPSQIIVLILLTMGMALPWIPGFIKPMLYYKGNRIVLDIMFSAMLLLIAVSPFLTTILRLSLRNDLIGLFKRVKK